MPAKVNQMQEKLIERQERITVGCNIKNANQSISCFFILNAKKGVQTSLSDFLCKPALEYQQCHRSFLCDVLVRDIPRGSTGQNPTIRLSHHMRLVPHSTALTR